ncbi:MAG: alpha/beta fold hydrolase [Phycisphaerae bacterium]|nr:alpha/beta fold hydrolase [Phycisphaerae bacterium]
MRRVAAFVSLLVVAAVASGSDPVAPGREDLFRSFLAFEEALAEPSAASLDRRATNIAVDRASIGFFAGRYADTMRTLADEAAAARGLSGAERDAFTALLMHRFVAEPRELVIDNARASGARIAISALPYVKEAALPERLTFVVTRPDGSAEHIDAAMPATLDLAASSALQPGTYRVDVRTSSGLAVPAVRVPVFAEAPAATIEALRARLDRIVNADLETDVAATRSRLDLAAGRVTSSAGFLADRPRLLAEIDAEIRAYESGRFAWLDRRGEAWRSVPVLGGAAPVRVLIPESLEPGASPPLVIALHGAGADESMFLAGYGRGELGRIARAKGFVVACPVSSSFGLTPRFFDELVAEMRRTANVDPGRVYLVGHSMGAGAAARVASQRGDRVAGIGLIAGTGAPKGYPAERTVVVRAGVDGIVRVPIEADAVVYPDEGHLLVVPVALPALIDRLLAMPPVASAATRGTE